jgi:hypothetical protein
MKKTATQKTEEKPNISKQWLRSPTGQKFMAWWKDHRDSGYATRGVETRWGIAPIKACNTDRYMAEFYSDSQMDASECPLRFSYTAEDYERWAKEKQEADAAVEKFAREHDGREIPTQEELMAVLKGASSLLAKKLEAKRTLG